MSALSLLLVATIGAFFIHTASFAAIGPRAHQYPGGALAFSLTVCLALPERSWPLALAVMSGALLGHVVSTCFWRWARPTSPNTESIDS